jgi:WD40 repeat protein
MQVASIPRGRSTVERAVFTPSGDLLLVTVQLTRATAALWNFVVAPALELGTVGHSLRQFAFLGKKALLVRDDTKIWNVFWDRKVRAPRFNEVPSPCSQTGYALAGFSSDGSRVACIGTAAAEMVEVWSTSSPAPSRVFRRPAASVGLVQLSPDGSRLAVVRGASGSREDTAEADIWDIDGGRRLAALPALKGGFEAVAFAPDNASIAIVKHDGTADVWDLGRLRGPRNPPMPERRFVLHHGGVIFALAYNPNPRFPQIATVGDDGLIKLWNSASGESIHTDTKMHEEDVHDVAFSADGRRMATSSTRGQVRLWDTADGRAILVFYGSRYTGIAFSQDGALLAMAADNGLMQLEILDVDWLTKIARERLDDLKKKRQGRAALEP